MGFFRGNNGRRERWGSQLARLTEHQNVETAEDLLRQIVEDRGNTLVLLDDSGMGFSGGPCGMWVHVEGVDMVWVDPAATGAHRDAILCHEAAHMLNGDGASSLRGDTIATLAASSFKHIDMSLVEAALARTTYDAFVERRAEACATWVSQRLARRRSMPADVVLDRMRGSLDSRSQYW
ncbi:hypothetical protein ACFZAM_31185 [Streptomyces sp. NPDC008079]|uniref:hypothetical protein n=1 Tax=Streptomyces sp. NPDC008079 TaxID=3364806 RepID=UPI0036E60FB1